MFTIGKSGNCLLVCNRLCAKSNYIQVEFIPPQIQLNEFNWNFVNQINVKCDYILSPYT